MNFLSVLYAKAGITVDGVTTLNNTATGLTPATNDNSTKLATTGYVKNQNYYPYPTGTTAQYVRGDGSLATFTQTGGGGSSVSYYLNGSVSQGTIGGNAYYEMSKTAIIGTNADFNLNADGYIAQFVTDAGDPALLSIPGGNWNFEMFFSASSGGGSPSFYVELYKYDGTTLTLIASGSAIPESITGGTSTDLYVTALAVPTTTLTLTDRLAVRVYVNHSGRTITLHTQNGHLCQVITTFTTGLTALNGLTAQVQNFAVGAGGTDFNISSVTDTHTFNLPTASATKRGALSSIDWSAFDAKVDFGDLSATSPLSYNGSGVFSIAQSSTSTNGYLSSTDWTTFNNKIGGSGTANYIAKFTSGSVVGNSIIYDNGTNVGIGTTTPGYKLEVNGGIYASNGAIRIASSNPFYFNDYGGGWYMSDSTWIRSYNAKSIWIDTGLIGGNGGLTIGYGGASPSSGGAIIAGNVLIGTSTDAGYKLDVNGTARVNGNVYVYNNGGNISFNRPSGANVGAIGWHSNDYFYVGGHPDYGSGAGNDVRVYGFGANLFLGNSTSGDVLTITNAGKVGIGTTSPSAKLVVKSPGEVGSYEDGFILQRNSNTAKLIRMYESSADGFLEVRTGDNGIVSKLSGYSGTPTYFLSNVGIGEISPSSKLQISTTASNPFRMVRTGGSATDFGFEFGSGDVGFYNYSSSTYGWYLTSAGNFGIGTTNPQSKLQIGENYLATAGVNKIITINTGGYYSTSSGSQYNVMGFSATTIDTSDIYTQTTGESIKNFYLGIVSDFAYLNNNRFSIFQGGAERLTIQGYGANVGNVGIGTTNPTQKLDVNGQASIGSGAQAIVGTDGTYAGYSTIGFGGTTNGYNRVFGNSGTADGLFLAAAASQGIAFWTNGANQRMFITSGGNVLINITTDAGYKFDVNGTGRFVSSNNTTALTISAGSNATFEFKGNSTSGYASTFNINDTALYIGHNSAGRDLVLQTASVDRLTISGSGAATFSSSVTAVGALFTSSTETRGTIRTTFTGDNSYYSLFSNDGALTLDTYGVGGSIYLKILGSTKLIIAASGNLLLGTVTDAGYKLDVNGTARVVGALTSSVPSGTGTFKITNTSVAKTWSIYPLTNGAETDINFYEESTTVTALTLKSGGAATFSSNVNVNGAPNDADIAMTIQASAGAGKFILFGRNSASTSVFNISSAGAAYFASSVTATNFIVPGGTSAQFLKADGSLDSNVYLTSTSSTFSYTASVTLSPTWQNTGVSSANLGTGAYLVTCNANDFGVGGLQYNCTYTGLMYFFAGGTNGSDANEIVLHHTGHADNGRYIYLRTLNTVGADGKTYLQISGNGTNSGASNYQLTFKKLL